MTRREHERVHPRLKGYDYGQAGAYFVTVCINKRHWILSEIVGRGLAPADRIAPTEVKLLPCGRLVEKELLAFSARYPSVHIDKYVIMPNHIHVLFRLDEAGVSQAGASPRPTLPQVVGAFKSLSTRAWKKELGNCTDRLWQTSYHDHIIRSEADYRAHWAYIEENPARWTEDEYYFA